MSKMKMCFMSLLLLGACKGPAGSKGDAGLPGKPGAGSFVFINGNVSSDDFTVSDSRISAADQIGVYVGDGTNAAQLPYFLPGLGVNTFYVFRPGQVEIVNAVKANATKYVIEIIEQ